METLRTLHPMWEDFPDLQPKLEKVNQILNENINTHNPQVTQALKNLALAGGKFLRPAFFLIFAGFNQTDDEKMPAIAAAIESLHLATLVHDDLIDHSDLRRGQRTISSQFGTEVAVYAGDYLFVVSFKLLAGYAKDLRSIQANSKFMGNILSGELDQYTQHYNFEMTIDDYLTQINGKTAELFALSAFLGAYESGSSRLFAKKAEKIGMNIGMAFQILDDILDYTKSSDQIGKPSLEDVRQGVYSAPLIFAMNRTPELRPLLEQKAALSNDGLEKIQRLVIENGGVDSAKALAKSYTDEALSLIQTLPSGKSKDQLTKLTKKLLNRQN